jgi:hypothetical protein
VPSPTHPHERPLLDLRWVALVGILGSIATLEYIAGQAAGWGWRSVGVPLGIDTFVMGVLLAPGPTGFDRLAALGLMEFTVIVSAVADTTSQPRMAASPNVALGADPGDVARVRALAPGRDDPPRPRPCR